MATHISVLVAIPSYGQDHLTNQLLDDLMLDIKDLPMCKYVVIDNKGTFNGGFITNKFSIHRPESNLKWIGSANWCLAEARLRNYDAAVVLNNDVRVSRHFLMNLLQGISENEKVAVAAPSYDDFWPHQRTRINVPEAIDFVGTHSYRNVSFCDGTAMAFSVNAIDTVGLLDDEAFPEHGYGSDLDYGIRVAQADLRTVIVDGAYASHLRRATMDVENHPESEALNEILAGMSGKWGRHWRQLLGLSEAALTAVGHSDRSSWYAD